MTDFSKTWAEFGVTGLALGCAVYMIWFLLKEHRSERKDIADQHREERKEWRDESQRQNQNVISALDKLADAVSRDRR